MTAEYGALVSAHIRDEGNFVEEAVEEFITIIKASGARGIISHHKAAHRKNHGKVNNTLKMIEEANAEGLSYVNVGGAVAAEDAVYTGAMSGKVLRRKVNDK